MEALLLTYKDYYALFTYAFSWSEGNFTVFTHWTKQVLVGCARDAFYMLSFKMKASLCWLRIALFNWLGCGDRGGCVWTAGDAFFFLGVYSRLWFLRLYLELTVNSFLNIEGLLCLLHLCPLCKLNGTSIHTQDNKEVHFQGRKWKHHYSRTRIIMPCSLTCFFIN